MGFIMRSESDIAKKNNEKLQTEAVDSGNVLCLQQKGASIRTIVAGTGVSYEGVLQQNDAKDSKVAPLLFLLLNPGKSGKAPNRCS